MYFAENITYCVCLPLVQFSQYLIGQSLVLFLFYYWNLPLLKHNNHKINVNISFQNVKHSYPLQGNYQVLNVS